MGKSRRRKSNRSNITFPKSPSDALQRMDVGVPRIKWRHPAKGEAEPTGRRLSKYGLTEEEKLMQYAPEGSAPERLVFGWLVRNDIIFQYQVSVAGGRAIPGGAVLDFVIYEKDPPIVLRIQSYWHESASMQWADEIQMEMLTEIGFRVEDVYESEVNTVARVDQTMREILFGAPRPVGIAARGAEPKERCPYCTYPDCVRCD